MSEIEYPPGDYCILELFGHTTLVGRYTEVERFGTKMLALEPIFNDVLLPAVLHGGAAIYRFTPCSADVAYKRQPRQGYQMPPSIMAIVSPELLPAPSPTWGDLAARRTGDPDDESELENDDDDRPF